jgi:hypothetical protein
MADEEIDADPVAAETKPVRSVAKKQHEKPEDESARMKRIMAICSGC